jgi:hypothetical protein
LTSARSEPFVAGSRPTPRAAKYRYLVNCHRNPQEAKQRVAAGKETLREIARSYNVHNITISRLTTLVG